MFNANVYTIMLGAPSGMEDELHCAEEVIRSWNNYNADTRNTVILTLHWLSNTYPATGGSGQDIINKQLVDKSDMLWCFFSNKLGTPTSNAESGTVEEIQRHIDTGKNVMVFFDANPSANTSEGLAELKRVIDFKKSFKDYSLYSEYSGLQDLKDKLTGALGRYMNEVIKNNPPYVGVQESTMAEEELSEYELSILKKWVDSGNERTHYVETKDCTTFFFGNAQEDVQDGREKSRILDFFEKLKTMGFLRFEKHNSRGNEINRLTGKAYEFIDNHQ